MALNLYHDSEEARRAGELARELVSARAHAIGPERDQEIRLFSQTLTRVLSEILGDATLEPPLLTRLAYLVSAVSRVGAFAAQMAAVGMATADPESVEALPPEGLEDWQEELSHVLELIATAAIEHDLTI
jgi:hypothetical protein